jgi:hypothetical protein
VLQAGRTSLVLSWGIWLFLIRAALPNGTLSIVRLVFATKLTPVLTSILAVITSLFATIQAILPPLLASLHARRLSNRIRDRKQSNRESDANYSP